MIKHSNIRCQAMPISVLPVPHIWGGFWGVWETINHKLFSPKTINHKKRRVIATSDWTLIIFLVFTLTHLSCWDIKRPFSLNKTELCFWVQRSDYVNLCPASKVFQGVTPEKFSKSIHVIVYFPAFWMNIVFVLFVLFMKACAFWGRKTHNFIIKNEFMVERSCITLLP